LQVSLENIILLDRKHQDYGPTNIAQSGAYGCVVRMGDKWARLNHLYTQKRRRTINEPILDSFRDISNYGLIAILLESNKWPST